jgi:hypothetical protein
MESVQDIIATMQKAGKLDMARILPIKSGLFGEQGTGKTTTAALLAAAISKQFHNGAPVWVTDPELGWQFPKKRIFAPEGIEMVQRTVPTFKALLDDLRAAEKAGACVYAVELAKPWMELLKTVQKNCGDRWGSELVRLWGEWVMAFLNSPLHIITCARVSDITEDVLNEQGEIRRIKVAEGMKAGGQRNNFGYEPHLVLRMTLERKPRRKKGKVLEDEGRMVHRCDVLKDRTWELNGKVFRFPDRDSYKPGDFRYVWQALEPHFRETQEVGKASLDATASSTDLLDVNGSGEFTKQMREKKARLEEFDATMELLYPGQTAEAKRMRAMLGEMITGLRSRTRMEDMELGELENAALTIMTMERRVATGVDDLPTTPAALKLLVQIAQTEICAPREAGRNATVTEMVTGSVTENLLRKSIENVRNGKPKTEAIAR